MIDWNQVNPTGLTIFMTLGILLMVFPRFMMTPLLKLSRALKPIIMKPVEESLPDWNSAPDWAAYVAQEPTGEWRWHNKKPKRTSEGGWISTAPVAASRAGYTKVPTDAGADYLLKTLQKRP